MRWSRVSLAVGLATMLLGALDPLEGAPILLCGAAIAAAAAALAHSRHARPLIVAAVSIAWGVAAMSGWSAVGGFGGAGGRSLWWAMTIVPYPVGTLLAIAASIAALRDRPLLPLSPAR